MAKNNEKFVSRENAKTLWGYMVDLLTGKYTKPSGGIPKSDLESSVQTSLGKADTALQSFEETDPTVPSWAKATNKPSYTQDEVGDGTTYKRVSSTEKDIWNAKGTYSKPSGGIPKSDLASAVQTSLEKADSALQSYTETDPTVPSWAKQTSKPSYNSDEISDTNRTHKFATQAQLNQISTNQTNILYTQDMICDTEFSTSTAYAVGDIVRYENGLYEFISAHSAGAWNSAEVTEVNVVDKIGSGGGGSVDSVSVGGGTPYTPDANGNIDLPAYPTPNTYTGSGAISVDASTKVISHSTSAGYKHIPSGGSTGQFLKYSSSGTASWQPLPYGSESAQGAVRVWVTTVGSETVLHISNQAAT